MTTASGRRVAIGDIHGCVHALETIINVIEPGADDEFVLLGDVIDKGRETRETIDLLLQLSNQCSVVLVQGNHEEMFFGAMDDERLRDVWFNCGGVSMINSYRFCGGIDDVDPEHVAYLQSAVDYYETDEHIFVHANYCPHTAMEDQLPYVLRWSLVDEHEPERHQSDRTVIVGHTEQRDGELLVYENLICLDTYCHGHGWLTAMDVGTGQIWQASRWGALREGKENAALREKLEARIRTPAV